MPDISVPWGREDLHLALPDHWEIQQVALPAFPRSSEDWRDRLARSLNQPAAGPSLGKLLSARRKGRIVLLVEDATRHSPLPDILDVLLREIRFAKVDESRLEVFFCTGMHPPMTPEQAREKLGESLGHLRWRSNDWGDRKKYTRVGRVGSMDVLIDRGVVEADLRIVVSSVAPHLQAGFGGGYKMLLPGACYIETVRSLHRLGLTRTPRQLVGLDVERNPMRQAIHAGGQLVDEAHGKSFSVQYLLDEAGEPAFVASGEVLPTHRMVAKQCAVAAGIVTSQPADVLLVNSHPLDYDLWQCFKCIPNTRWAVRPNGVIICLARCEGLMRGMDVPQRWPLSPTWMRRLVRWLGPDALASLLTRSLPHLAGDAGFFIRLAMQTLHRNPILMVSPALYAAGAKFPGLTVLETIDQAVEASERLLRNGQRRVTVFPAGGITFPIPSLGPLG